VHVDKEKLQMTGNLAKVYRALYDGQIKIGTVIGYGDANPLHAEITPGAKAAWHVVETFPAHERIAGAHLSGRRFGIYVPEVEGVEVRRGRKAKFTRPMFPGYILVFTWDIRRHVERIMACPGVWRLMLIGTEFAILPDEAIDKIRQVENAYRPLALTFDNFEGFRKKTKRWRRTPRQEQAIGDNEIVSVRPWSAFTDGLATSVDGAQRNQILRKALGLPS
jgi:transcription antitermination factor NusG